MSKWHSTFVPCRFVAEAASRRPCLLGESFTRGPFSREVEPGQSTRAHGPISDIFTRVLGKSELSACILCVQVTAPVDRPFRLIRDHDVARARRSHRGGRHPRARRFHVFGIPWRQRRDAGESIVKLLRDGTLAATMRRSEWDCANHWITAEAVQELWEQQIATHATRVWLGAERR